MNSLTGSLIRCFYEAQDCSKLRELSLHRFAVCLSNPVETYAFGYVLVHAPIQWHLTISDTRFDILTSSVLDHIGSGSRVQGSIVDLRIDTVLPPFFLIKLEALPAHLLEQITELHCIFSIVIMLL